MGEPQLVERGEGNRQTEKQMWMWFWRCGMCAIVVITGSEVELEQQKDPKVPRTL